MLTSVLTCESNLQLRGASIPSRSSRCFGIPVAAKIIISILFLYALGHATDFTRAAVSISTSLSTAMMRWNRIANCLQLILQLNYGAIVSLSILISLPYYNGTEQTCACRRMNPIRLGLYCHLLAYLFCLFSVTSTAKTYKKS